MRLENIRANFNRLSTKDIDVYFSYETPIAFTANNLTHIRENDWGPTTGRHLNYINDDKKCRIEGEKFLRLLEIAQK